MLVADVYTAGKGEVIFRVKSDAGSLLPLVVLSPAFKVDQHN